jgi:imidazolonepropionase-like amidohydrolase
VAQSEAFFERLRTTTQRLIHGGVMLVAGTDAPYPGVFLGEGIHRELELLVEAGLSPLNALSAATRNPAILLNQEGVWGTLTPGASADILIIDGNPSQQISDTRRIEMVIQQGQVVDRESLEFDRDKDPGFRIRRDRQ